MRHILDLKDYRVGLSLTLLSNLDHKIYMVLSTLMFPVLHTIKSYGC